MSDRVPITVTGKKNLEIELKKLKTEDRPAVIKQIAVAREHGDLKENAEYHAARDKQSFVEGRIQEVEDRLARAEVIDPSKIVSDKVMFGAYVVLINEEGEEKSYQIVGEPEADLSKNRISISSPIARSLMGKKAGDEVTVKNLKKNIIYELESIEYK